MSINYTDLAAVRKRLFENQDLSYKEFHKNLVPGKEDIIGVRSPAMKVLAKEIAKSESGVDYLDLSLETEDKYYEETLLQGLVIGFIKIEPEARLRYIKKFIPKIDNWAVCDSFCAGLKFTKKNQESVWSFIAEYLKSDKEYDLRFASVMLMNFYIDDKHIDEVLKIYDRIDHEAYYTKMAVAWGLSVCFIKYPDKTMKFFKKNNLDDWTYNKALQKCTESLRVDKDTKSILREMKRHKKYM